MILWEKNEDCENKFLVIGELVALVYCESIQNSVDYRNISID